MARKRRKIHTLTINKEWAMPNKHTFSIPPIKRLLQRTLNGGVSIDPFANTSKVASITNDLCEGYNTDYVMDALDFLKSFDKNSVDIVLFDPPYSTRQISECYKSVARTVNMETTQSSFWGDMKKEISRIVKYGGSCITCGWNSGGIGKTNGFVQVEILLVAHGGWHNDTIVTVERKV